MMGQSGLMKTALMVLAATAVLPLPGRDLAAQANPRARAELERQIRERWQERIREELKLDDEQEKAVRAVLEEFTLERRQLALDERQLRLAVERHMRDLPGPSAAELLDRAMGLRERELTLYRQEMQRLGEILTPDQLLRFGVMREELAQRVRQLAARRSGR
jgi:Spy/CpxP family protein refolding chaperone